MKSVEAKYLYHYTSVENLALILESQNVRFNSLDRMDDAQERENLDGIQIGQHVFVSCWTDESKESIPMWNMYSGMENGVRIKLPAQPFDRSHLDAPVGELGYVTKYDMLKNGIFCDNNRTDKVDLFKIEYTDDEDYLNPRVMSDDTGGDFGIHIYLDKIGHYKSTAWEFQQECRYALIFFPFDWSHVTCEADIKKQRNDGYGRLVAGESIMTKKY
ncbi:MAG: DUF2971 domain-containing protein [Bifidobacterium sp.]|nr:DUF2971 domain-containing protein [Bifidobacterium sp.]